MSFGALFRCRLGVVMERREAKGPWARYEWHATGVLNGTPAVADWTVIGSEKGVTRFYAGAGALEFYRTETANYDGNIRSGAPALWVVLRSTGSVEAPYEIVTITADPAEGEAFTEAGSDLVERVPMPAGIRDRLVAFVAEHGFEQAAYLRQRD